MASEMAASLSKQEGSPLGRVSHILDPNELLMFHIKPVQRLLKYHLLFEVGFSSCDDANEASHESKKLFCDQLMYFHCVIRSAESCESF